MRLHNKFPQLTAVNLIKIIIMSSFAQLIANYAKDQINVAMVFLDWGFELSGKKVSFALDARAHKGECVKLEDRLSKSFSIQRGVRQGSVLSPTLFLLFLCTCNYEDKGYTKLI